MPSQPEAPKRRSSDRTKAIAAMYGLVAGAVLMLAGLAVILFDVFREAGDLRVMAFGIGLVLLGGTAALPATFMPILSAVLKKIPWGKTAELSPPTLPTVVPDEDDKP